MDQRQRQALWNAWVGWARGQFQGDEQTALGAAAQALWMVESGGSTDQAVAAARAWARQARAAGGTAADAGEAAHLAWVISDLETIRPTQTFTAAARGHLLKRYRKRLDAITATAEAATALAASAQTASGAAAAATMPSPAGPAVAAAPAPTAASPRVTSPDAGVLILSYIGAFMLVVATLLFEIYGLSGFGGGTKFSVVLALNLFFGAAGYYCYGNKRLHIVGETYVAIFALMAPLVFIAAYEFLALREHGIEPNLGLFVAGVSCSVLYGALAARLQSVAYAGLALVALPVGVGGLVSYAGLDDWLGLAMVAVAAIYAGLAYQSVGSEDNPRRIFAVPAQALIHVVAAVGLLVSLSLTTSDRISGAPATTGLIDPALPATLLAATALYTWFGRLVKTPGFYVITAIGTSLSVLALNYSLRQDAGAAMVELVALAWAYALAAPRLRSVGLADFMRAGAAVQALAAATVPLQSAGDETALLLIAAGVGVFLAVTGDQPLWLLVAGALFADAWFFGVKALLPPPPEVTAATVAANFSAVPVIYGIGGLILGRLPVTAGRRMWSAPLYILGAVIAVAALSGLAPGDPAVLGWVLLGYSAVIYLVGVFERQPLAAPVAGGGIALGVLSLVRAADIGIELMPLAMVALGLLVYSSASLWHTRAEPEAPAWTRMHEWTALGILALNALVCFGVPSFMVANSTGAATSLLADLAFAGLLFGYGRTEEIPGVDYVAAFVASLGTIWIADFVGETNAQSFVLGPSTSLLIIGDLLRRRTDIDLLWSNLSVGAGAAILLGTIWLQSYAVAGDTSVYTAELLLVGIVAIVVGVSTKSRVMVIAGGAGVLLASLRALFQVIQVVPLSVVFGALALLILAVAAALALARDQLRDAGTVMGGFWREWR